MGTEHRCHRDVAPLEAAGVADWLSEREIATVECCFVDLWGVLGSRRLTATHFEKVVRRGISMPRAPYLWSSAADIVDLPSASAANGYPNLRVFPDLTSLRPAPWVPQGAVCFLEGGPLDDNVLVDSRAILRTVGAHLDRAGLRAQVASELEFYLLRPDGSTLHDRRRPFSRADADALEPVLGEVRQHLVDAGVEVESSQTEYGPGQVEINISGAEPLRNADNAALLRAVVKGTAARHGLQATFMAMPVQGSSGSGHHLHLSLWSLEADTPPVFGVGPGDELSPQLSAFVAGVLEWAPALTPVYLPSVNAYKRTADYTFAPNRLCWALDNRSASVRIPPDRGADTRLELRIPSADCNPYLASAALLASGLDGVQRRLTAPPPLVGDAYLREDLPRLPTSLGEALAALVARRDAVERLLPIGGVTDALLVHGARDLAALAAHVTDWELQRYLSS
jgi:glutamine synthetase